MSGSTKALSAQRKRGGWSSAANDYVARVVDVLNQLSTYWPLTLRQVYYQLVARGAIANEKREYSKLSRLLTKARLDGLVPWDAIEDRVRATLGSGGWPCAGSFVQDQTGDFLDGYRRDLLQSQDVALELWVEKDALSRLCHQVAFEYCVPVIVARGFSSISYVHECRKRVEAQARAGRRTVILYFGDLDPSGWEMLPSMLLTLQQEMGLGELVVGQRRALLPEHVEQFSLPHSPDAIKGGDTRARKYVEQFGDLGVELDALPPATLQALVREAIESNLDLSRFEAERLRERAERDRLEILRHSTVEYVEDEIADGVLGDE